MLALTDLRVPRSVSSHRHACHMLSMLQGAVFVSDLACSRIPLRADLHGCRDAPGQSTAALPQPPSAQTAEQEQEQGTCARARATSSSTMMRLSPLLPRCGHAAVWTSSHPSYHD